MTIKTRKTIYKISLRNGIDSVKGWRLNYLAIRNLGPRHWIIDHLPTGTMIPTSLLKNRKQALELASSLELLAADDGDTEDRDRAAHVIGVALKELRV